MKRTEAEKIQPTAKEKRIKRDAQRGYWASKTEFVLTLIGYAIGIGNVWRFPYLCYRSGGGAFLVPYTLMVILCGIPLFYMEVLIGQFSSTGCTSMFRLAPLLKGTGICMMIVNMYCVCYYSVIISYPIRMLYYSCWKTVPWINCEQSWNSKNCTKIEGVNNTTDKFVTPADEFFHLEVLRISSSIAELGTIVWEQLICLLITWIIIFACVVRGIKSVGKVAYFTAPFPYVLLTILFVRGVTLPGAATGIKFFFYPEWHRLLDLRVWSDAAVQMFFGLGPGWGGIINMASFNRFHNNAKFDSILVVMINVFTSIYAGIVVFSVLGFLSKMSGKSVSTVATSGAGLAFVTYPEAIAKMPIPQLWAFLFFIMLFLLGIDSVFVQLEAITTSILDEIQVLRKYKLTLTTALCIFSFGCSSIMCTNAGMYILQLFDWYSSALSIIVICLVEIIMIMYIYGIDNFLTDVEFMLGKRPNLFWRISWKYITPIVLIFILLTSIIFLREITYNGVKYPKWAVALGWLSFVSSIIWIPLYIFFIMILKRNTLCSSLKRRMRPLDWTPADPQDREEYEAFRRQRRAPKFMTESEAEGPATAEK
ncbi:PREDICTED: sodium- and chloride-dependent glycine transporter 1 isoform X1 [Drosophila arizonae]|uniref:Transporter n=1 Tax=Drosophila arizonae TaxID=7263 RepID=A0ABM1PZ80_DROAR|nr:PREDICTED: sodium- and chloride-dependent glycine transporter 1 isoform X1 [Drosophila arizonae]